MSIGFVGGVGGGGSGLVESIADTDSLDLAVPLGVLSGTVRLSADAADAASTIVSIDIRTGASKGLRAQVLNATIRALLSATGPIAYDTGTGVISIPVATDIANGYLSAADHTTYSAAAALAHAAVTLEAFGATPNADGLTLTIQALKMQPASETFPGGVSTSAQVFGGEKRFPAGVKIGSNAALTASLIAEVVSTTLLAAPMPSMTTVQRDLIATPATGGMLYNTNQKHPEFYNGTLYAPIGHTYAGGALTPTDASTITPADTRNAFYTVSGNAGAAVSITNVAITNAKNGDKLVYVGTSDTATVTFQSGTDIQTNGTCTLASGDSIEFMYVNALSKWIEMNRTI